MSADSVVAAIRDYFLERKTPPEVIAIRDAYFTSTGWCPVSEMPVNVESIQMCLDRGDITELRVAGPVWGEGEHTIAVSLVDEPVVLPAFRVHTGGKGVWYCMRVSDRKLAGPFRTKRMAQSIVAERNAEVAAGTRSR